MDTLKAIARQRTDPRISILHAGIVGLTLTTAVIHALLGGPLFTLNAIGYTTLAVAMLVPGPLAGIRWLIRLALLAFTVATIGGWLVFGARFGMAYVDKGVEVVLVATLAIDVWLEDGGRAGIAARMRALVTTGLARIGIAPR